MSMGLVFVEVCDANAANTQNIYALETEFPSVTVMETSCMSQCEHCALYPYVFVDGEFLTAGTVDELVEEIRLHIKKVHEYYDTEK